ncbi:MAG: anaerobic ribonucleoside-triphosphate reductase activating protein [Clostridia bacterium]|nr:anaerobic ribonucleoside-triphosphate reductase activating protein [Clostridia bacterium]
MKITKFIKNSLIDFPRRISSVVFTNGCNWNCWYCQNNLILNSTQDKTEEFFEFLKTRKGLVDGVVICGGEPTIHNDLPEFIKKVRELGFAIKLDTNGTNPDLLKSLIEQKLVDYVAMDIKAPLSKLADIVCSKNSIQNVQKSVEILLQNNVEYEFRSTITPDLNTQDIEEMAKSIIGAKQYILQQYHEPLNMLNAPKPLKIEVLQQMCEISNKYVPTIIR